MPSHTEHPHHEHGDGDGHEPRAACELRIDDNQRHDSRRARPDTVHERSHSPARAAAREPVAHHSRLRQRERGEDPDHVEVDEVVRIRAIDPEQQAGDGRKHEHPVREDQAVAKVRELARREAVAGKQRREPRKTLEGRIRGEDQNEQRQPLHGVVHEARDRPCREDRARDLRHDRRRRARPRVQMHREIRDAEEEEDRDRAEDRQGGGCVLAVRLAEGVHAVGDRLDPGERRRTGREGAQEHEERDRAGPYRQSVRHDGVVRVACRQLDDPDDDEHSDGGDEEIGREREHEPRLTNAAQIGEHDQDEAPERECDLVAGERWSEATLRRRFRPRSTRRPSARSR